MGSAEVQRRFQQHLSGSNWLIYSGGPGEKSNKFAWTFASDHSGLYVQELRDGSAKHDWTMFVWKQVAPGEIRILRTHCYPGEQALDSGDDTSFEWLINDDRAPVWETVFYLIEIRDDLVWISGLPNTPDLVCDWFHDQHPADKSRK